MQRYLMNFDTKKLPQTECDCLIVGGGVAGLAAAWYAAQAGLRVTLAVKDTLPDSNSHKAQGGIAAVFGKDDTFELHTEDTLIAGAGLCDEAVVRIVVAEGRQDVQHLMDLGAVFDRLPEGALALGREGCHSRPRILHAKGDATGAEVVRALAAAVGRQPNVTVMERSYIVDLLVHEGECSGALVWCETAQQLMTLRAAAVVLATGGTGRLFRQTTNPAGATGSGMAAAYRAGAELMDMEFVQFHPTALSLPGRPSFLISEAVRGAGAVLVNAAGRRFMKEYHEMAELAPRDVVARAIFEQMGPEKTDPVYLDATGIEALTKKFPTIAATCREYGLDIEKQPIPIEPAAHYMMGGIRVDEAGRTNIPGLFACGEAACTRLHGANRLASNSLLEALVFGRRAAAAIAAGDRAEIKRNLQWQHDALSEKPLECNVGELQSAMSRYLGIVRDSGGLAAAQVYLQSRQRRWQGVAAVSREALEYRNMLTTAQIIAAAALQRQESRGAHYRCDYPLRQEQWRQHIIKKAGAKDEFQKL